MDRQIRRQDYPVTGSADTDSREYTQVNAPTRTFANKKGSKVRLSGKIVVAADGKSRTVTVSGTDPSGKKITSTAVYDKAIADCIASRGSVAQKTLDRANIPAQCNVVG